MRAVLLGDGFEDESFHSRMRPREDFRAWRFGYTLLVHGFGCASSSIVDGKNCHIVLTGGRGSLRGRPGRGQSSVSKFVNVRTREQPSILVN